MKYIRQLISVVLLLCLPEASFAHSVYIFAWVDGLQVCTESYFTRSSKVRGGEVVMADAVGGVLAEGVTDQDGLVCFSLPDKAQALEFTVLAGAGHKGGFRLEEGDIAAAISAGTETAGEEAQLQSAAAAVSEQLTRRIVQEELQKQLSPIRQYLAEKLEDKTPGLREIVGGIGWLAGLGAFGFWFSQRRKKQ